MPLSTYWGIDNFTYTIYSGGVEFSIDNMITIAPYGATREVAEMPSASYKMREAGSNRPFTVRGTGDTVADALAEANAKVAMTVGTVESATFTDEIDAGDQEEPVSASGLYSDANLVLRNSAGRVVNVHLENVTTAIGTGVNGVVDLTDSLVTAFATAYKDGNGNGGYTPFDGRFIAAR